ncbi:MAG: hypothetical protein IT162_21450 [Bryobacterales bacterium]|nr:hypothetical protein [Bryobacterales bacterium]
MSVSPEYSQLRQYLLGALAEPARAAMEDRLFAEPSLFELAEIVEADLMDEYAAETLAPADRVGWERYLASHPESQRRLAFSRAWRARRRRANVHAMPRRGWYAAAALLAAALLMLGFFTLRRPLDAPRPAPVVVAAVLSPGTLRSSEQAQTIRIPAAATVVRIEWRASQAGAVRAVVRSVDSPRDPVWTGPIAQGRSDIPAAALAAGDYLATTVNAAGADTADYTFRVMR